VAKKPKTKRAPSHNLRSKPISFRLDKTLVDHLDIAAERVHLTRNRLVSQVLEYYVVDCAVAEMKRIVDKEAERGKVDLFA
jgi:predicted transcriptional regulator